MRGVVLLAMLAVAAPVHAQPTAATPRPEPPGAKYAGRVIGAVRLAAEGRETTDPVLLDLVETRRGQPLSIAAVRESIAHLFSLGRFEDIQVDAVDSGSGVDLTYYLVPLHTVDDVKYEGNLGLPESLLRRTIRDRYGAAPRPGRRDDMARTLQELYRERGYYGATVRPVATVRHDPDRTLLTFEIEAGPRAQIGTVSVEGDTMLPDREFLDGLGVAEGDDYEPIEVQRRLSTFIERLRQKGYYEATGTHHAKPSADGLVADIVFDVHPGPAVTVTFEGDRIARDRLDELVSIQREGSVDEDLLEDTDRRIAAYLHQQGYWKASVTHERKESGGTLAIVFRINRGSLYRVAGDVAITGNRAVPIEELRPFVKIQSGDVYIASRLDAAIAAMRDLYLRRGFAAVKLESAANETDSAHAGEGAIRPVIVIAEGPRTIIDEVVISNNSAIPEGELRALIRSARGEPFYAPTVVADRDALLFEYLNRGFASASVEPVVVRSDDGTRADIRFDVREGAQTIVDHVLIVGNTRTDAEVIERELLVRPGEPLGLQDVTESQRRLSALGLFRRVRITELVHGSGPRRDVLVSVEEAAATSIEYGGGLEGSRLLRATGPGGEAEDRFEIAPRGFFDIGRRNLGGKNRSVNLYTRVSLRPSDPADDDGGGSRFGFSEYRVVGTYREPRALGIHDVTLTAAVEQGVRSSFNFARKGLTSEVIRRIAPGIRATARYSFGTTRIFDERFTDEDREDEVRIDRLFPQVRLSAFSGAIARDTRDDLADPARGTFFSAEGSLAARSLGGQVGFLKTYLQGFWFRRVPGPRRLIFASRVAVGLADGFEREVARTGPDGSPLPPEIIEDLPASERFFAGGDTTIRGFALDSVGAEKTISTTGFPRGGNAVFILNGELRIPVWGALGTAVFIDGGNVFERVHDVDFGELRGAGGFGVRYLSPIGPVRVDFGFKLDRRQFGDRLEPRREIHFSIGHVF